MQAAPIIKTNFIHDFQTRLAEFTRYTEAVTKQLHESMQLANDALPPLPSIWYSDFHVHYGKNRVSMSEKPLIFRLFQVFIDAPGNALSREVLLQLIYPNAARSDMSKRMKEAQAHNLVKLLGRARQIAEKELCGDVNCRWFVHDLRSGQWTLREIKNIPAPNRAAIF